MARAPFQVLVFPYIRGAVRREYALFRRADNDIWQAVAGGGEDAETPLEAARREAFEETGISPEAEFLRLDTLESIPAVEFKAFIGWGEQVYVIPQYCFGVQIANRDLRLSREHSAYCWLPYEQALQRLHYDGNRTALWELECRLRGEKIPFDDGRTPVRGLGA